jgi:hypothetical protein
MHRQEAFPEASDEKTGVVREQNGGCACETPLWYNFSLFSWSGVNTNLYPPDAWERKDRNNRGKNASVKYRTVDARLSVC